MTHTKEIDKRIVSAYRNYVDAQKEYTEACNDYRPNIEFSVGDNVYYVNNSGKTKCGRIHSINYDPYRFIRTGPIPFGFSFLIKPLANGFKEHKSHFAFINQTKIKAIKKAEGE